MGALEVRQLVEIRFKRLAGNDDLPLPEYATEGSAAFDLRAGVPAGAEQVLEPGARLMIETGFAVAIPDGYEMQIRPRSGIALRHGVTVMNSPATIDSDYRGHVCVCLVNLGREPFVFRRGDRIAQAVVAPVTHVRIVESAELDGTLRGLGGFGSTGMT